MVGKNLNLKYENYVKSTYTFERNIKDFYCFNSKNKDMNLFFQPNNGFSYINLFINLREGNDIQPEKMQALIVNENYLIDHDNKDDPLSDDFNYYFTSAFNSYEYTEINYNFQYIKYESDDGYFFKNSNDFIGMYFSAMTFIRKKKKVMIIIMKLVLSLLE